MSNDELREQQMGFDSDKKEAALEKRLSKLEERISDLAEKIEALERELSIFIMRRT